ncbi:MAG: AMP-binding protein [Desulfomonile sp.]|nr:AMP-binding protein [Desulfomonile sp.]
MIYDEKPWLKFYDSGVAAEVEIPSISFVDRFNEVAVEFRRRPALHFLGITMTYEELNTHANRFANFLLRCGCGPGDVVGIHLPNLPQYLIAQIGALKAGCATSGVSPLLTPRELTYQLNDCKVKALVTLDATFEHRLAGIFGDLPDIKLVVATGALDFLPGYKRVLGRLLKKVPTGKVGPVTGKQVTTFREVLSRYPADDPAIKVAADDNCLIQYTGGTTGLPKGTVITHRNVIATSVHTSEWARPNTGHEVFLSGFPFFHLAGLAMGLCAMYCASAQVLIPNPRDTKGMVKEIARYRPTILVNVPSLYLMLLEEPGFQKLDFSRLGYCLSGASPFAVESIRALEAVVGEGKLLEVYGMTESTALITMNPRWGQKKIGTVGMPLPNTRVRIVDLETRSTPLPLGEPGELIVSGPQIMKEYFNKPDETANSMRKHDGGIWFHTGDVAKMDEEGYITIVDRAKDMLSVSGFKVFSRELEEKLYEHPAIEFCAIVGVPNPKRPGSDIVRLVYQPSQSYKSQDPEQTKKEILEFARKNFAPYKVPKIIDSVDAIPLTAVGKVDKKALR